MLVFFNLHDNVAICVVDIKRVDAPVSVCVFVYQTKVSQHNGKGKAGCFLYASFVPRPMCVNY